MTAQGVSVGTALLPLFANVSTGQLEKPVSGWGDVEISRHLLKNFETFADPKSKEYITRDSLLDAAYPRRNSRFTPQNTAFARELLSRHDLMDKLDGDRKGKLDDKIDRVNIQLVLGDNGLSGVAEAKAVNQKPVYEWSDRELAIYLEQNFDYFEARWPKTFIVEVNITTDLSSEWSRATYPEQYAVTREVAVRPQLRDEIFTGKIGEGLRMTDRETLQKFIADSAPVTPTGDSGLVDKFDTDGKGNLEEKSDSLRSDAKLENENPIDIGQMSLEEQMYDLQRKFALAILKSHARNA